MIRQSLSQKQLQKLSPHQIQLMKLLQIPTATLEQRIKEELEANPALEEGLEYEEVENSADDLYDEDYFLEDNEKNKDNESLKEESIELDDYLQDYIDDDVSNYKLYANNYSADDEDKTIPITVEKTFQDYLETQLGMLNLQDEEELIICKQLIGSIDEDGYLRREIRAIVDDLMFSENIFVPEKKIEHCLLIIQSFDPPGVGARTLQESLFIQLVRINADDAIPFEEKASLRLALRIIEKHFSAFSKKHYAKLTKKLNISENQLKRAIDIILKLNPKPASGYRPANASSSSRTAQYIVPDFTIVNRDGELDLILNSRNAPDLRVNDQYQDMLRQYTKTKSKNGRGKQREAVMFIKQKIESARWFIDAIVQRQQTMYKTMYAILQFQYDFFLTGDDRRLRPMILKDISDVTGLDISTISRVANSKYVQTEFGIKRLKEFFSESLTTTSGEEVSTLEVKQSLLDIVNDENKRRPLSDEKLKILLQEKGYPIARRTVAKYREQLNIPVARLRKTL